MYVLQNIMQKNNSKYNNVELTENFFLQNSWHTLRMKTPVTWTRLLKFKDITLSIIFVSVFCFCFWPPIGWPMLRDRHLI